MKQIRYVASGLLMLTGILHFIPLITDFSNPNAIPMAAFGIAYGSIGYFLYRNKAFAKFLGILVPIIGLGAGFLKIGFQNWDTLLKILFAIDGIVIVCCILLLNKRRY
jgi:hypothetical protein